MKTFWYTVLLVQVIDILTKLGATRWASTIVFNTSPSHLLGAGIVVHALIVLWVMGGTLLLLRVNDISNVEIPAGLVFGGCLATLISTMVGPPGVMDFIPLGYDIYTNMADICLWAGILGVWYVIGRAILHSTRGIPV